MAVIDTAASVIALTVSVTVSVVSRTITGPKNKNKPPILDVEF